MRTQAEQVIRNAQTPRGHHRPLCCAGQLEGYSLQNTRNCTAGKGPQQRSVGGVVYSQRAARGGVRERDAIFRPAAVRGPRPAGGWLLALLRRPAGRATHGHLHAKSVPTYSRGQPRGADRFRSGPTTTKVTGTVPANNEWRHCVMCADRKCTLRLKQRRHGDLRQLNSFDKILFMQGASM